MERFPISHKAKIRENPTRRGAPPRIRGPGAVGARLTTSCNDEEPIMDTAYLVTRPHLGHVAPEDLEFGQKMLGKFLGQLVGAPEPPEAICLYTEGVKAALEGSPVLGDLEQLEAAGVPILLCGTCIEHYGVADRVRVGEVVDMQRIAIALGGADKVVTV